MITPRTHTTPMQLQHEQGLPIESIQMPGRTFFKLVCECSHLKWASQSGKQTKPDSIVTATFGSLKSSYWTTNPDPSPVFWKWSFQLLQGGIPCWCPGFLPARVNTITTTPAGGILLWRYNCRWTTGSSENSSPPSPIDWIMYLI